MVEILSELEDSNEREKTTLYGNTSGQMNFERNADFLNKEISFLLDNLRKVSFLNNFSLIESDRSWLK